MSVLRRKTALFNRNFFQNEHPRNKGDPADPDTIGPLLYRSLQLSIIGLLNSSSIYIYIHGTSELIRDIHTLDVGIILGIKTQILSHSYALIVFRSFAALVGQRFAERVVEFSALPPSANPTNWQNMCENI